ncbi:hypothetical protein ACVCII_26070 [Burkholderia glumae]
MGDKFWLRVIKLPGRLRKNWHELRRRRNAAIEEKSTAVVTGSPASSLFAAVNPCWRFSLDSEYHVSSEIPPEYVSALMAHVRIAFD